MKQMISTCRSTAPNMSQGSYLDLNHSMGYKDSETWCVAALGDCSLLLPAETYFFRSQVRGETQLFADFAKAYLVYPWEYHYPWLRNSNIKQPGNIMASFVVMLLVIIVLTSLLLLVIAGWQKRQFFHQQGITCNSFALSARSQTMAMNSMRPDVVVISCLFVALDHAIVPAS